MLFYANENETLGYMCEEQVPQEVKDNYTLIEEPIRDNGFTNEPTQLDRIEAQVMYTALLTDTLIESEVE